MSLQTTLDFNNYSYATSLPAYKEPGKDIQARLVMFHVNAGANNLLQLSQIMGLPQSTVAGRVNDCIKDGKLKYEGFIEFEGRKRKRIVKA